VENCFIFWREKQSAISETYGNNTRMRVTHRFEIRLIIGIIRTVSEAYESHRLLADLRCEKGKIPSYSFIRKYQ